MRGPTKMSEPAPGPPGQSTPAAALLAQLLAGIERELPRAVALRHRLHADPELAHAERQTAAAVSAELPVAPARSAETGLLVRVGPASGAPVAVRAELDGLPIEERTGVSFTARGQTMHACGHDVHMAALVALARAAHGLGAALPAPLLGVFQPSEEAYPSGAEQLVSAGLGEPSPTAIVAAHVHPELPWGAVALDAGTINASCDYVEIVIEGESAHGAYPHRGSDAIAALAHVVLALHTAVARRFDPLHPVVLTVGTLAGGEAENVIAARASAGAALRAYRPADRQTLRELVHDVVTGVASVHGCSGSARLTAGEPALANDSRIVARARELLPAAGLALVPPWRSYGSDDFAFFGVLAPLAMAFVGLDGAEGFRVRPLHHPELLPPDAAVGATARALAALYAAAAGAGTFDRVADPV